MSETGILSQEYQNAAKLFQAINLSVVLLKKDYYQLAGAKRISPQELSEARRLLESVLRQLVAILGKEPSQAVTEKEAIQLPPFFLKRLQERHKGTLQWYAEDLEELWRVIHEGQPLTAKLISRLDELCGQLDAETTSIYRKLWRA